MANRVGRNWPSLHYPPSNQGFGQNLRYYSNRKQTNKQTKSQKKEKQNNNNKNTYNPHIVNKKQQIIQTIQVPIRSPVQSAWNGRFLRGSPVVVSMWPAVHTPCHLVESPARRGWWSQPVLLWWRGRGWPAWPPARIPVGELPWRRSAPGMEHPGRRPSGHSIGCGGESLGAPMG